MDNAAMQAVEVATKPPVVEVQYIPDVVSIIVFSSLSFVLVVFGLVLCAFLWKEIRRG